MIVCGTIIPLCECIYLILCAVSGIYDFIFGKRDKNLLVLIIFLTLNLFLVIPLILFIRKLKRKEPFQTDEISGGPVEIDRFFQALIS